MRAFVRWWLNCRRAHRAMRGMDRRLAAFLSGAHEEMLKGDDE